MSVIKRDPLRIPLVVTNLPESLKWGKPLDFIKKLPELLAGELPRSQNAQLVIVSSQTPSEDDKNSPWFRLARNGMFLGLGMFQQGAWRRVYIHSSFDVVWKWGDSRNIEDGFELIDGNVGGIPSDVQLHIMKYYKQITSALPDVAYSYFATVYTGNFL